MCQRPCACCGALAAGVLLACAAGRSAGLQPCMLLPPTSVLFALQPHVVWGCRRTCCPAAHGDAGGFVSMSCLQKFGPDTVTVYCTCQMPENPDRSM